MPTEQGKTDIQQPSTGWAKYLPLEPRVRLALAAGLFIGWLGYLAFLVAATRQPVILSRPQFLNAGVYVVARLDGDDEKPANKIHVLEVAWPKNAANLVGTDLAVEELQMCDRDNGWNGPGEYILPLTRSPLGAWALTEIPASPGFSHNQETHNYLRIYPATTQLREQLTNLIADFHGE